MLSCDEGTSRSCLPMVKEEVELALSKHLSCMNSHCGKQIYPPMSRSLQLQFINKLSLQIFTGTKIKGEDCSAISIALVDGLTGAVVTSGPESLMKVEMVVLEGDFAVEEENNWTIQEFKNNIVREREGKRLLLTGDVFLELINEGIGSVGDLSFTDNSSWTRSRKFTLGARVVDGYFNGMRVREAKTEEAEEKTRKEPPFRRRNGELIGCGAFGHVYMGMNLDSGELLTVKQDLVVVWVFGPLLVGRRLLDLICCFAFFFFVGFGYDK